MSQKINFNFQQKMEQIAEALVRSKYDLEFGDREESIKTICDRTDKFVDYTNIVANEQARIAMIRIRYEDSPEDMHYFIENIDRNRRNAHNAAIAATDGLNRILVNELGIKEGFVDIDTSERSNVADFAATFTGQQASEIQTATTMSIYAMSEKTTQNQTRQRLSQLLDKYEDLLKKDSEQAYEHQFT